MIKQFYLFFTLIFVASCAPDVDLSGNWLVELELQDQSLPFVLKLNLKDKNKVDGTIVNGSENIPVHGELHDQFLKLKISGNYSVLNARLEGNELIGFWERTNRENYKVNFKGAKTSLETLYGKAEQDNNLYDVKGKWKINLGENKFGLGQFDQVGSRVFGSILTPTGDYRFLDGVIENNILTLTGFDGTFNNVFKIALSNNDFTGIHYSGNTYNQKITGVKDNSFELPDPKELTKLKNGKNQLALGMLKDINGKKININNKVYADKLKIIQVFGSWCPNCLDETHFFLNWKKENKALAAKVAIIALAFEKFETKKEAVKALKKYKAELAVDYPIVLMDFKSTKTVTDYLPFEKIIAFPTMIILGKDNKIVQVHTGFSGQATGPHFELFKREFQETILKQLQ